MASHTHPGSACTGVGHPCNPYFTGGPCGDTTGDCTNGGVLLGCSGGAMGNFLCEHEYYVVAPTRLAPMKAKRPRAKKTAKPAKKTSRKKKAVRPARKTTRKKTVSRRRAAKKGKKKK